MSIYDLTGSPLSDAYNVSGDALSLAYDKSGDIIYTAGDRLKVMTYNVGGWYIGSGRNVPAAEKDAYYALQTGMIEAAAPDILFINEYLEEFSDDGTSALTMLQSLFPYVERVTNGTYFGRAICSTYPISNYSSHTFSVGSPYYYDSAEVVIDGTPVTLVVIHLIVNPETTRYTQAQELLAYLQTLDTFICAGDFNTGISTNTATTSSTEYEKFVKIFVDAGFHTANFGSSGFMVTCNDGVNGTGTDWYIDNIITSADIDVVSAYVDTTKLTDGISGKTDHMPLIALLEVQ